MCTFQFHPLDTCKRSFAKIISEFTQWVVLISTFSTSSGANNWLKRVHFSSTLWLAKIINEWLCYWYLVRYYASFLGNAMADTNKYFLESFCLPNDLNMYIKVSPLITSERSFAKSHFIVNTMGDTNKYFLESFWLPKIDLNVYTSVSPFVFLLRSLLQKSN